MRSYRAITALLVAAVLVASCSTTRSHPAADGPVSRTPAAPTQVVPTRVVPAQASPTRLDLPGTAGVRVVVPGGVDVTALGITALPAPAEASAALAGGSLVVLSAPVQLSATAALPIGTRLQFTLPAAPPAQRVLLASYDSSSRQWTPVPTQYDASTRTASAVVPHFSIWAPLGWGVDAVQALFTGAMQNVFGSAASSAPDPSCADGADVLTVSDSLLNGAVRDCAEVADAQSVRIKVTNTRAYAVDVVYPSSGSATTDDPGSTFEQIGAALQRQITSRAGVSRTLLPPRASAVVTVPLLAGGTTQVGTELDGEAYLVTVLKTGIDEAAFVYDHVERTGGGTAAAEEAHTIGALVQQLAVGQCLKRAAGELQSVDLSLSTARTLGDVGLDCLQAAVSDSATLFFASAVGLVVALGDAVVQSAWVVIDTASGASRHVLTVQRGSFSVLTVADLLAAARRTLGAVGPGGPTIDSCPDPGVIRAGTVVACPIDTHGEADPSAIAVHVLDPSRKDGLETRQFFGAEPCSSPAWVLQAMASVGYTCVPD